MKQGLKNLAIALVAAVALASVAAGFQAIWQGVSRILLPVSFSWSAAWSLWIACSFAASAAASGWREATLPWMGRLLGPSAPAILLAVAAGEALRALGEMGVMEDGVQIGKFLLGATSFAVVYFLPAYVARWRKHRKLAAIIALDVLSGFTLVGWVAALVWALAEDNRASAEPPGGGVETAPHPTH